MAILSMLILSCLPAAIHAGSIESYPKKVAVVLSGGGAKGAAHIGALKLLEEAGIHPDFVVGTSMGAVVGGLYSIGYTTSEMDSLIRVQDWNWLLSDKTKRTDRTLKEEDNENRYAFSVPLKRKDNAYGRDGLVRGQNINNLFSALTVGYHDSISFNLLPIPFACVATDITDGSEVVLECGVLAEAMRSSMAIPGIFSPVRKDCMILVDGGLVNNFPVDVARKMGADIVIGVDVQDGLHGMENLNSLSEIASQIIDIACRNKYEQNCSQTDVYIKVNVKGFTAASFASQSIDTLIHRGYVAANSHLAEIAAISSIANGDKANEKNRPSLHNIYVTSIRFNNIGNMTYDNKWMLKKCGLSENSTINMAQIEYALSVLRKDLNYPYVSYRLLRDEEDTYQLVFQFEAEKRTILNLGFRFDSEEVLSLLASVSVELLTHIPSVLSATGRVGKQYMAQLQYTLKTLQMHDFNIGYTYCYHDIDIYRNGNRVCNVAYNHHNVELDYTSMRFRNFRYKFGLGFEYYHNPNVLYNVPEIVPFNAKSSEHLFRYFFQADYNTQDKCYFPTRGVKFQVSGYIYTDDMIQYKNHSPFYTVSGMYAIAIPLMRKFTLEPVVYGRIIDGNDVPYFYANTIGCGHPSKYFSQQLPFAGIGKVELTQNTLLVGHAKLRYNIVGKNHISIIGNVAVSNNSLGNLFSGDFIYGVGLGYSLDSKLGPIEASVGYSNRTENINCYINVGYYF